MSVVEKGNRIPLKPVNNVLEQITKPRRLGIPGNASGGKDARKNEFSMLISQRSSIQACLRNAKLGAQVGKADMTHHA